MRAPRTLLIGLILLGCFSMGCDRQGTTYSVSVTGRITVAGEPLSGAVITFQPIEGTSGPKASAPVFDGNYRIEPTAKLRPGTFLVRVSMLPPEMIKQLGPQLSIDSAAVNSGRVIAAQFDSESKTTVELHDNVENEFHWQVSYRSGL